jgi:hypothetical protein
VRRSAPQSRGAASSVATASARRIAQLEHTVEQLRTEMRGLRAEVRSNVERVLRLMLRRRGLTWKNVLHQGCLLPDGAAADDLYRLLRHYSFRLFLRDVIRHREHFGPRDLVRYCSPATARRYLQWLAAHALVRRAGRGYALAVDAVSFGPTLEWFVASALEREYGIPSVWNLRLDGNRGGGDYDVVGYAESILVYVEAKSSPPRNIEVRQVQAFFDRLETLRPHLAIFLNDTQLRMRDKIVELFADEIRRRGRRRGGAPVVRVAGEIFRAGDGLFVSNSDPDLVANLGVCLAHYFRRAAFPLGGAP